MKFSKLILTVAALASLSPAAHAARFKSIANPKNAGMVALAQANQALEDTSLGYSFDSSWVVASFTRKVGESDRSTAKQFLHLVTPFNPNAGSNFLEGLELKPTLDSANTLLAAKTTHGEIEDQDEEDAVNAARKSVDLAIKKILKLSPKTKIFGADHRNGDSIWGALVVIDPATNQILLVRFESSEF
jgi:hypothetical protein